MFANDFAGMVLVGLNVLFLAPAFALGVVIMAVAAQQALRELIGGLGPGKAR